MLDGIETIACWICLLQLLEHVMHHTTSKAEASPAASRHLSPKPTQNSRDLKGRSRAVCACSNDISTISVPPAVMAAAPPHAPGGGVCILRSGAPVDAARLQHLGFRTKVSANCTPVRF